MAFIESPRLNDRVRLGFVGGPRFKTSIVTLDNGKEQRNQEWARARWEFEAPFTNADPEVVQKAVRDMFFAARGMNDGFRFKDWDDYQATNESLGTAPSGSTAVQLIKTYAVGFPSPYVRNILKPVSGTVTVYENGVAKAGTLDTTTGLFTPTSSWTPAAALTWTGEFDVPVRFDDDALLWLWDNKDVRSTTVRLVETK